MKLIDEWKTVLHRSWSNRLAAVTALLAFLQAVVPSMAGVIPDRTFAWLSGLTAILTIVMRLVAQPDMPGSSASDSGAAKPAQGQP